MRNVNYLTDASLGFPSSRSSSMVTKRGLSPQHPQRDTAASLRRPQCSTGWSPRRPHCGAGGLPDVPTAVPVGLLDVRTTAAVGLPDVRNATTARRFNIRRRNRERWVIASRGARSDSISAVRLHPDLCRCRIAAIRHPPNTANIRHRTSSAFAARLAAVSPNHFRIRFGHDRVRRLTFDIRAAFGGRMAAVSARVTLNKKRHFFANAKSYPNFWKQFCKDNFLHMLSFVSFHSNRWRLIWSWRHLRNPFNQRSFCLFRPKSHPLFVKLETFG